jgi:hypothetical protein
VKNGQKMNKNTKGQAILGKKTRKNSRHVVENSNFTCWKTMKKP